MDKDKLVKWLKETCSNRRVPVCKFIHELVFEIERGSYDTHANKNMEALLKIREIVSRKYVMNGRLSEIHDVLEELDLPKATGTTESPSEAAAVQG